MTYLMLRTAISFAKLIKIAVCRNRRKKSIEWLL